MDNYFTSFGSGGFASDATSTGLSFLGGAAGNYVGGMMGSYFGQKNSKEDAKRSWKYYQRQALFDYQMAKGPYFDLAKKYDEKNYALAQRYSENSATWARRSLENAGLNPILAASQGFNASMGFQGQQFQSSSGGMPSFRSSMSLPRVDGASFVNMLNNARQVDANVKMSAANTENIKAQTLKTLVDAINEYHSQGGFTKAPVGAITRLFGSGDLKLDKVMSSNGFDTESIVSKVKREGFDGVLKFLRDSLPTWKLSDMASDWLRSFIGDRDTSHDSKTSLMRKDVSSAKSLADVVSPSPNSPPIVVPVKTHAHPKKHRKIERHSPNPLFLFH